MKIFPSGKTNEYSLLEKSVFFKKLFTNYGVPMNRALGIKLKSISEYETVLSMKDKHKNTNYGGSVHGAAIMALAETVHGVAVLNRLGAFSHLMVTKNTDMTFLKRAKGDLEVRFQLNLEKITDIEKKLNKNNKCEVELESTVTDKAGDAVAKLNNTYIIKRKK